MNPSILANLSSFNHDFGLYNYWPVHFRHIFGQTQITFLAEAFLADGGADTLCGGFRTGDSAVLNFADAQFWRKHPNMGLVA